MTVPVAPFVVTGLGAAAAGIGFWLHKTGKLAGLLKGPAKNELPVPKPNTPVAPKPTLPPAPNLAPSKETSASEIPLKPGYKDLTEQVKVESKASAPAKALYAYLKAKGVEPETAELKALTKAFQKAHNADKLSKGLGGALAEDGLYGPGTSAALTMYTNDPIPGNPKYQPRQATLGEVLTNKVIGENGSNAGVAYQSQFNIREYLKKHGHDNSATEKALVRQLQHDINTDPLFPGPSYKPSPKPPFLHPKMSVDGIIGPQTKGAILSGSSDEDFPVLAQKLKGISTAPAYVSYLKAAGRPVHLL